MIATTATPATPPATAAPAMPDDLAALLRAWPHPNPVGWRASIADWFEEHAPAAPVEWAEVGRGNRRAWRVASDPVDRDELPAGFNDWFHRVGVSRAAWVRNAYTSHRPGRISNGILYSLLKGVRVAGYCQPFDHFGAADLFGVKALVGEPYHPADEAEAVAAEVQGLFPLCPVTYARSGSWNERTVRLAVWFTLGADRPPAKKVRAAQPRGNRPRQPR